MNFDISNRTILLVKHGSQAYGLALPDSDLDIKGVAIEPLDYHLGFLHRFEQHIEEANKGAPHDLTIYSLKKFAKLATEANPNLIEMLFVDESDVLYQDEFGTRLRAFRENFLSTRARHSFSGYAHSQLNKMRNHHDRWLAGLPPIHVKENPVRAELEAKIGYNAKHASQLIRLMRTCVEILRDGTVKVRRPDRDYLLAIKRGEVSYDAVIAECSALDAECESLYTKSCLPREPDRVKIDRFVCELTTDFLISKGEMK